MTLEHANFANKGKIAHRSPRSTTSLQRRVPRRVTSPGMYGRNAGKCSPPVIQSCHGWPWCANYNTAVISVQSLNHRGLGCHEHQTPCPCITHHFENNNIYHTTYSGFFFFSGVCMHLNGSNVNHQYAGVKRSTSSRDEASSDTAQQQHNTHTRPGHAVLSSRNSRSRDDDDDDSLKVR